MPMRLPWQKAADSENLEVTLPDEVQRKLDGAASKEDLNGLKTTLEKLQESMKAMSDNSMAEAEERRKAAERRAAEQRSTQQQQSEEELAELALTDPLSAMKRVVADQLGGRDKALLTINASSLKREVFEDQEKYPFYTGAIKDEVDKILSQQRIEAQNDRTTIEHAYHSVVGQHYKDLAEGKLKSRFASSEGDRGSQGKAGPDSEQNRPRNMSDDEKKIARMLGFAEADYGKMLDEEGVGFVS